VLRSGTRRTAPASKPEAQAEGSRVFLIPEPDSLDSRLGLFEC
jgi:hypothetical protein